MSEIERAREFVEELVYAEEIINESVRGLNNFCPIGEAKKRIVGVERNCKIIKLDPTFLKENPYIKNIHVENWQIGNAYLSTDEVYEEYKTNVYNTRRRDEKSLTTLYEFCYFPQTVHYPSLGIIYPHSQYKWMGVEPGEINSFSSFVEEASGKVLLMGCGLGYVAYMLSLKENVDEVTIIELNPFIKKIFETYLKPQMNGKISIFQGDAIKFLESENLSSYQYCSVDIWHDAIDMFPIYLKCLLLEQKHPHTQFHYWLEDDLHVAVEDIWINILKGTINCEPKEKKPEIFTDILNMQDLETVEAIKQFITTPKRPIIQEWVLQHPKEAYHHEGILKTLKRLEK